MKFDTKQKYFLLLKIKWEMYTVPRLKQMAKDRGHRGYSSLRRDELLNLLNPPHLLDQDVPNINVLILVPVQAATPPSNSFKTKVKTLKSTAKNTYDDVKKKTREFAEWILDYVPESIKRPINKRVEALKQQVSDIFRRWYPVFQIRESKSALKGITKQYTIDGKEVIRERSQISSCRSAEY